MSWRNEIRSGSFRGAPFLIRSNEREGGRRAVNHEYPKRDVPYSQDLGRKTRKFTIEVFVLGDDYFAKRNRLIDACEKEGIGELIHPYYGSVKVICDTYRVHEDDGAEGRKATFSLTLEESGERKFPSASNDTLSQLGAAKISVFSSSSEFFKKTYSAAGLPTEYVQKSVSQVQALGAQLSGARGLANSVNSYYTSSNLLLSEASGLVLEPASLASNVVGTFGAIAGLRFDFGALTSSYTGLLGGKTSSLGSAYQPSDADGQMAIASSFIDFGDKDDDKNTEAFAVQPMVAGSIKTTEQRSIANTTALKAFVQLCALAAASDAAGRKDYATIEDALQDREFLCEKIDQLSESVQDDEVYNAISDLKIVLIEALPDKAVSLPKIITIRKNYSVPAILLSYDLYESLDKELDIVRRNRVVNPAFVPAGKDLQVISNG